MTGFERIHDWQDKLARAVVWVIEAKGGDY
jgi:hypothetical protein